MFEFLNDVEDLTKEFQKKEFYKEMKKYEDFQNIKFDKLVIVGKTYRSWGQFSQETYIGILNELWYFYIEIENNIIKKIFKSRNIDLSFDFFYSRELIKKDKESNIKEIKVMLLYKKLQNKLSEKKIEKGSKI